jgi:hypothetical protein
LIRLSSHPVRYFLSGFCFRVPTGHREGHFAKGSKK